MLLLMIAFGVVNRIPAKLSRMRALSLASLHHNRRFCCRLSRSISGVSILFISDRILLISLLPCCLHDRHCWHCLFRWQHNREPGNIMFFGMLLSIAYNLVTNSIYFFWGQDGQDTALHFPVFVRQLPVYGLRYMLFSLLHG